MKIEIWSDIVCPFCYIGKRKFENALKEFDHKDEVEVTWRSFQLQPDAEPVPGKSVHENLASKKGISVEQAKQMGAHVTAMAKEEGLEYNFDKAKVANTLDAHRVIHLAAKHGLQDEAEERIFKAYFTEGADLNNHETLARLGAEIGLKEEEVKQMLASGEFAYDVKSDQQEAANLGIQGVPFFVINRKYGVSGAQPSEAFLQTMEKVWEEESQKN